jgi:hypothetical protein
MAKITEEVSGLVRVHTPNLIKEILLNSQIAALRIPLLAFKNLLVKVAERASVLNDKELNQLMMRLVLYEVADPMSAEYDAEYVMNYLSGKECAE